MMSAASRAASARARRAFSALPGISPSVGLSCAIVIAKRSAGRGLIGRSLIPDESLRECQQPGKPGNEERQSNGRRAHILDAADLYVTFARYPVGELLDGRIQQLDHEHEENHADEGKSFPGFFRHQKSKRHSDNERGQLLTKGRLAAGKVAEAVPGVDGGA